jgi:hypothetical protein
LHIDGAAASASRIVTVTTSNGKVATLAFR